MPTETIHIVFDARTSGFHFSGIGRYIVHLAGAISALLPGRARMTLLTTPNPPPCMDLRSLAGKGVTTLDVPFSAFSLQQQWAIPRILNRIRATMYHSPYFIVPYFSSVPTVITIHDVIPLLFPGHVSVKARLFYRILIKQALRKAGHIITVSEASRRDLIRLFRLPPAKVTAISLAAAPGFKRQPLAALDSLRTRYKLRQPFFLYLGSNKPHKNIVTLLRAWKQLDSGSVQLVIAGRWDARHPHPLRYVKKNQMQGRVKFIGEVEDTELPVLYSSAHCFVFPSLCEGFGLPVVEAMACGTPVACSDTPGLKETAGDAALFFDPENREDMISKLSRVMSDATLRFDLKEKGLSRVKQLSWERTAAETLEIYKIYAESHY